MATDGTETIFSNGIEQTHRTRTAYKWETPYTQTARSTRNRSRKRWKILRNLDVIGLEYAAATFLRFDD